MIKFVKLGMVIIAVLVCVNHVAYGAENDVLAIVELQKITYVSENRYPILYKGYLGVYKVIKIIEGSYKNKKMEVMLFWHYSGDPDKVGNTSIAKLLWSKKHNMYFINANELTLLTPLKNGKYGICDPNKGRYVMYQHWKLVHPLDAVDGYTCKYGMNLKQYLKIYAGQLSIK